MSAGAEILDVAVKRDAHAFDRSNLEAVLTRRFFVAPSFEIYSGCAGFFDLGPPGSALQSNLIEAWRKHFVIEEEMLEVDTTIMTLSDVFKTSGHVDRFTDWMCHDSKTGDTYRADHVVEDVLESRLKGDKEARGLKEEKSGAGAGAEDEKDAKAKARKKKVKTTAVRLDDKVVETYENILAQIDNYSGNQLGEIIRQHEIKAPATGNDLTSPVEFNLMFDANIGPTGYVKGYLRPETAQGHFINFGRLLEFNNGRVPFASAQVGKAFRNEISPRNGLLRVREFLMAEIEHYVDPLKKSHDRFQEVAKQPLRLLPKNVQLEGRTDLTEMTIGEAVEKKIVDNETLGYFLVRIYLFLTKIGINPNKLRFRQHMDNEMAHYASDCWDAEIETSYGWIECVGCADRSAYDLTVHTAKTNTNLVVREALKTPITKEVWEAEWDRKKMGPVFKKEAKIIEETVNAYDQERLACVAGELEQGETTIKAANGQEYKLIPDYLKVTKKTKTETVREFTPNVIEPSFGIGRILAALLEHSYWAREEDVARGVLSFPPLVAPTKVLIVPLSGNDEFKPMVRDISYKLRRKGISSRVDDSNASIGKRYARNDELGTPFGITIDFASVKNNTITIRERDTMLQRIGQVDQVIEAIESICDGTATWQDVCQKLPAYSGQQDA